MRPRLFLLAAVLASIVVGTVAAVSGAVALSGDDDRDDTPSGWQIPTPGGSPPTEEPSDQEEPVAEPPDEPSAPPQPRLDLTADVSVDIDGFLTWAALDRRSGDDVGAGDQTSTTESMIKAWIVADFLRRTAEAGDEPSEEQLDDASAAIRDSHNGSAEALYQAGGRDDVVERMIDRCGLTDTEVYPSFWSRTETSARDAVRLGECLADGTAAGEEWTEWVLTEMRKVRGTTADEDQPMAGGGEGGAWGIVDGLPEQVREQGVSIKNGWTAIGRTGNWHIACLAITDDWVMAVLMQYPAEHGLDYGAERCAGVARQLVPEPTGTRLRPTAG